MNKDQNIAFVVLLCISAILIGIVVGSTSGRNEACASVHAEWVKDKCMKVTRETL